MNDIEIAKAIIENDGKCGSVFGFECAECPLFTGGCGVVFCAERVKWFENYLNRRKQMRTYMCSECGFTMTREEDVTTRTEQERELEEILIADHQLLISKAKSYDKLMDIMFASMAVGEDKDGLMMTIHPEVVVNRIIAEVIMSHDKDKIEGNTSFNGGNPW